MRRSLRHPGDGDSVWNSSGECSRLTLQDVNGQIFTPRRYRPQLTSPACLEIFDDALGSLPCLCLIRGVAASQHSSPLRTVGGRCARDSHEPKPPVVTGEDHQAVCMTAVGDCHLAPIDAPESHRPAHVQGSVMLLIRGDQPFDRTAGRVHRTSRGYSPVGAVIADATGDQGRR